MFIPSDESIRVGEVLEIFRKGQWRCHLHYEKEVERKFVGSVDITVYKGSDIIYFDFEDRTQTYKLSAPADITIGARVAIKGLQSKKFCGFYLPKSGGGIIVDDEMPTSCCSCL